MSLPPGAEKTVRCPRCKRLYKAYVTGTWYRESMRKNWDWPLLKCAECCQAEARGDKPTEVDPQKEAK